MKRHINSMTTAQTARVCEAVLALTREWLVERGATDGRYGSAGAMADFNRDCYVGVVTVSYPAGDDEVNYGKVVWRLDHLFAALGEPEVTLRTMRH